jgi:hypothetical protein
MILLAALMASASAIPSIDDLLHICRPALARRAGGDIQMISPTSMRKSGSGYVIEGKLTAFVGMAPPEAGSASAHHLIRADFDFACRTAGRNVRQATVTPRP